MMKISLTFLVLLAGAACADLTFNLGLESARASLTSFDTVDVGALATRADCNGLCSYSTLNVEDHCLKYGFIRSSCFSGESTGQPRDGCYCCLRL